MSFRFSKKGFTLLEMMVVIAIITVMTGILLGNLPQFRDHTTLQLVAQEVAITIRQAQVFGIGTKVEKGPDGNPVYPSHGLFFCDPSLDALLPNPGCRKNFLLYSDQAPADKYFDGSGGFDVELQTVGDWIEACKNDEFGECREVFTLSGNIELCDLVVDDDSDTGVNVAFSRLYPDAFISNTGDNTPHNSVKIYLMSRRDKKRRVITLYNTGGVTLSNVPDSDPICQEPE